MFRTTQISASVLLVHRQAFPYSGTLGGGGVTMKRFSAVAAVLFSCSLAALAWAAGNEFRAKPGVFDPDQTGIVTAKWIKNLGLPNLDGSERFGLLLSKNGATTTNAAAGATIAGVK